jgi:hypothetical protein
MRTMTALAAGLALAIAFPACSRPSGAAAAADAMGATSLNSIQFSGKGTNYKNLLMAFNLEGGVSGTR